mgnify:FL=1
MPTAARILATRHPARLSGLVHYISFSASAVQTGNGHNAAAFSACKAAMEVGGLCKGMELKFKFRNERTEL